MKKYKVFFILALVLTFALDINSPSVAKRHLNTDENIVINTEFPDYSNIFVGNDKYERLNRRIYKFNMKVNKFVLKPINILWASVVPDYGTKRIESAYDNIEFPIRYFSCLLQKDFKASKSEAKRFFINTTIGIGGLYDPAKKIFKIEKRDEDMGQVLAHDHVNQGPYLVIPIVAFGNLRDLGGKLLDCPFNPSCYIVGPIAALAKTVLMVNKTTREQPLVKVINSDFADPYEITKKLYGVDRYIKNCNLDRQEVLNSKIKNQNILNVNQIMPIQGCKTDIELKNYDSKGALNDSLRTVLYSDKSTTKSAWGELSLWNRCFKNRIRTSGVRVTANKPLYKFKYILQKNKKAPLAIIFPSIGEGITSYHSVVFGKMLYDEGYSIIIIGSSFQWEFVKSMPDGYAPGFPNKDAEYLRLTTAKIISKLQSQYKIEPKTKILVGTSFGALTGLFTAAEEEQNNTLGISKYICISPPVDILFALTQIDKYSINWKNNQKDIKDRVAVTAEKVIKGLDDTSDEKKSEKSAEKIINLAFSSDETKLILGTVMKQKLSDLVFTLENGDNISKDDSKTKFKDIYNKIDNMSFYDYAEKYLNIKQFPEKELEYKTSLYSIGNYLKTSNKIKIYEAVDDYYTNPTQLSWLKEQTGDKTVLLNDGSHLGYLYRDEFINNFKKDIKLPQINNQKNNKLMPINILSNNILKKNND